MELIASPYLTKEDIKSIELGYKARDEVVREAIYREIEDVGNDTISIERMNYLAWLIYNNQLDIKIAVLKDKTSYGIYHEKLGVFEDDSENKIAFSGSSNETEGGLVNNFESVDVFFSWKENDYKRVQTKEQAFNKLWNNSNEVIEVVEFPEAATNKLLSYRKSSYNPIDPALSQGKENSVREQYNNYRTKKFHPKIPEYIQVRDYQQEAIISWLRNDAQGLLEMATGTGKTITALTAISKLYESINKLGVVIVCPYTHLVNQWVKDLKSYNMNPIVAYSGAKWEKELSDQVTSFKHGLTDHFCVIMTNDTFGLERMQATLRRLDRDIVFIADEAHHLGANNRRKKLIESFPYRLALSATPSRWYDDQGTEELLNYFGGKVVYEFGLNQAIGKFLTEYYYYPHIIYLDEDESEEYYEITKKLVKFLGDNESSDESEIKERLLIKRARILSSARNKLKKLEELMREKSSSKYNIVYCGDSDVDGDKQIDRVIKLLGKGLSMKVHSFTSKENNEKRSELLERFESGNLQALVAIKCLDEGVDVPATQNAYILASSTNPREFIQRRGRVLRKHKEKTYSYIHDFIVLPRELDSISDIESSLFNVERNLIMREMRRLNEFANLALNGPEAHERLSEVKFAYNLLDM